MINASLWIYDLSNEHYQDKSLLPYCSQTYSNRKINQQYSNRQIARLEEHTAIMHFFFALSLSFLIWWVTKISIVHLESYFSAALTYLMLRTMDCETFKNACWAKVQPFQAQPPKKSALGAALRSVQKAKTWPQKTWAKAKFRKLPISWQSDSYIVTLYFYTFY